MGGRKEANMPEQTLERQEAVQVAQQPAVLRIEHGHHGKARRFLAAGATLVAAVFLYEGVHEFVPSLPDIPGISALKGGHSDPGASGMVNYEGQAAEHYYTRITVPIGDGVAKVQEKGKRDWDRPGGLLQWPPDAVPTNGTSQVRDSKHGDRPATLDVTMTYCADGIFDKQTFPNKDTGVADYKYVFNMGKIVVCDSKLLHTKHNDAQFNQHNTPATFNGKFVSFMSQAAETTAAAAPCPTEELEKYTTPKYLRAKAQTIAAQLGEPVADVTVTAGAIGKSTPAEKAKLRSQLNNLTQLRDSNGKKIARLDVNFISGQNTAVKDACFAPIPKEKLSDIKDVASQVPSSQLPANK